MTENIRKCECVEGIFEGFKHIRIRCWGAYFGTEGTR